MVASTSSLSKRIVEVGAIAVGDARPTLLLLPSSLVQTVNPAARRISPLLRPGTMLLDVTPDSVEATRDFLRRCTQTTGPVLGTLRLGNSVYRCDGGRVAIADVPLIVLRLREQHEANATFHRLNAQIAALNAELGQRRRAESELRSLLSEKQLLLAEVNHRVKNNLAVMVSMTNMAGRDEAEPRVRQKFADLHSRITAIATVHSLLYSAENVGEVSIEQLLTSLTASIARGFNRDDIAITVTTGELCCRADVAVSLALIVNELVTNAYKHAFPTADGGLIHVALDAAENRRWRLTVSDNGATSTCYRRRSGLAIVEAIAAQLKGGLEVKVEPSKRFEVVFGAPS